LRKIRSTDGAVRDYEQIVVFNRNLLDTERSRLEVGTVGIRRVLEVDASFFEAKNAVVEAQVLHERARLELELVQGTILLSRNLELPQNEINQRTTSLLKQAGLQQPMGLLKDMQTTYERRMPLPETGAQGRAGSQETDMALPMKPADYERALRTLRETVDELDKSKPQK
jgi:hypothetical protein